MISIPDQGFVYPKTGLDVDLRFDSTPTYVSTGSCHFDGTNDYLNLDGLTWTTSSANFSIAGWFRSGDGTASKRLFGAHSSSNSHRLNFYWTSTNSMRSYTYGTGAVDEVLTTAAPAFCDGTWHHFALTVASGTSSSFYIDGQLLKAYTSANIDMSGCDSFYVGSEHDGTNGLAASVCHFGVWHDTLSQGEVRALMTASTYAEAITKGGSTPRAYYLLEADADDSVDTQDGTLTNGAVIVGDRARLPSGLDLTANQMNAQVFSGRAWGTDGAGDYLALGSPSDLDGFFNTGGTFAGWFNVATSAHYEKIFDLGTATTLSLQADLSGYIFTKDWSTTNGSWTYNGGGGASHGMWFHLVLSYNAASTGNDPTLYINGVLQTIDGETVPAGSAAADTSNKFLGIYNDGSSNPYDGEMADVKFITSTVTAAQALEMYQNPEQILPTGISSSALKCWLPLCDYDIAASASVGGLYFQDASGNGNHALSTNGAMSFNHPVAPQMGLRSSTSLVYFGGPSSGDYCESSDTDLVTNTFSFSIWVNVFSNAGGYAGIITGNDAANDYDEGITISLGNDASSAVDHISVEGQGFTKADQYSGSIAFGQWFHLAFTSDASDYKTYVNGSEVNSASRTNTTANKLDIIRLGARYYSSAVQGASQFDGLITGCGVFNAVIDSDSVAAIHAAGIGADIRSDISNYDQSSALVHFWKTDNPVTCLDLEGSDNLTVNGSPNIATIPESATADLSSFGSLTRKHYPGMLSGVNVYGRTATGSASAGCGAIMPTPDMSTGNWTISFWFRMMQPASTDMSLIYSYDASIGFDMFFSGATTLYYTVKGSTTGGSTGYATLTVGDYVEKWCHAVYRREGTSVISHYFKPLDAAAITAGDMDDYTSDIGSLTASEPHFGIGVSTRSGSMFYANAAGADFAFFRICVGDAWTDAQVNATHEQGARMLRGT